ncbi:MAG: LysR family transcriptional regulator [Clostridia bacterium]|nr:LysR family transcriptional regulator [Clostridia bacterium]
MEIRTLRYFVQIAYTKNMSVAANNLHVSQPALSHQMKELESELGCTLFERTNKATLLTDEGKHFLSRAEEILSLVDRTAKEYESTDKEIVGEISIGAGESSCMEQLGYAAKRLHEKHRGITFRISSEIADVTLDKLHKGIIDFALLFEPVSKENLDYIELPFTHAEGVTVPINHELASKDYITTEDLKNRPLIINSRQYIDKKYIADMYNLDENELDIVAYGNLSFNKAMLAKAGLGIVMGTMINTVPMDPELKFIPFYPTRNVKLIFAWNKNRRFSKAAELFLEEVKSVIQNFV